jgi:WG containing repeat
LTYQLIGKITLISALYFLSGCNRSSSLSSATPVPLTSREPDPYESLGYSDTNTIEGEIGIVTVREKEIYFDRQRGRALKPPGYFEAMYPFREKLARVVKGGKVGFIDETGNWAIPPQFQWDKGNDWQQTSYDDGMLNFHEGAAVVQVGEKYRFINKAGKFITGDFDSVDVFNRGAAIVSLNGKYGLIDKQGKFIIQPQFAEAPGGEFGRGGMLVKINGQEQCIDDRGTVIKIDACQYIARGGSPAPSIFEVKEDGVYLRGNRLADHRWKKVIKSQYSGIYVYILGEKWGLVHESGEVITPPKFEVTNGGDLMGQQAKTLYDYQYFYNGLAQAKIDGKYGFIDTTGKFVIPAKFENVESFEFDLDITAVQLGGKWGAIDRKGTLVIPAQFEAAFKFDRRFGALALIQQNGKYGFIDRQGKIVVPPQIDEILGQDFANRPGADNFYDSLPHEGLVRARIGKKWGYVNTQGKIQIPMQFDTANDFRYGVADVTVGSRTLYVDRQGKTLPF